MGHGARAANVTGMSLNIWRDTPPGSLLWGAAASHATRLLSTSGDRLLGL